MSKTKRKTAHLVCDVGQKPLVKHDGAVTTIDTGAQNMHIALCFPDERVRLELARQLAGDGFVVQAAEKSPETPQTASQAATVVCKACSQHRGETIEINIRGRKSHTRGAAHKAAVSAVGNLDKADIEF